MLSAGSLSAGAAIAVSAEEGLVSVAPVHTEAAANPIAMMTLCPRIPPFRPSTYRHRCCRAW